MQIHANIESVYDSLAHEKFAILNEDRLMRLLDRNYMNWTSGRMSELQVGYRTHVGNKHERIYYHRLHPNIHLYVEASDEV